MAHSSCCSAKGAGEADDGGSGGVDAYDVGAAPDFFVEPFLGVVGPDLAPVRLGEPGEGEYLGAGLVEVISCGVDT